MPSFVTRLMRSPRNLKQKQNFQVLFFAQQKKTFFAGGDLDELIQVQSEHATDFFNMVEKLKGHLRTIETLGIPVVAALNGTALGGGWEIALSCHHRIAINDPKVNLAYQKLP